MSERWRWGRKVGRTIYRQLGDESSDDDKLIGLMDTEAYAIRVVNAVNAPEVEATPRWRLLRRKRLATEMEYELWLAHETERELLSEEGR